MSNYKLSRKEVSNNGERASESQIVHSTLITQLKQQIEELQRNCSKYELTIINSESQISEFRERYTAAATEKNQLIGEVNRLNLKISEMQNDIEILIQDHQYNQKSLQQSLNESRGSYKIEIEKLKSEIKIQTEQSQSWQDKFQCTDKLKEEAQRQVIQLEALNHEQQRTLTQNQEEIRQWHVKYQEIQNLNTEQHNRILHLDARLNEMNHQLAQSAKFVDTTDWKAMYQKIEPQFREYSNIKLYVQQLEEEIHVRTKEYQIIRQEMDQVVKEYRDQQILLAVIQNSKKNQKHHNQQELDIVTLQQKIEQQAKEIENYQFRLELSLKQQKEQNQQILERQILELEGQISSIKQTYEQQISQLTIKITQEKSRYDQMKINYESQLKSQESIRKELELQCSNLQVQIQRQSETQKAERNSVIIQQQQSDQITYYKSEYEKAITKITSLEREIIEITHTSQTKETYFRDQIIVLQKKQESTAKQADEKYILELETLRKQYNELQLKYAQLEKRKQEVIRESYKEVIQIPLKEDKQRILELEELLRQWKDDYYALDRKKQQVIVEKVVEQVSLETDRQQIRVLEIKLEDLYSQNQSLIQQIETIKKQVILYETEMQVKETQITNLRRSELKKEIIQVPLESDKIRIRQLEEQLQNLESRYFQLSNQKQEVIRETVRVEVPSEQDRIRIRQLEDQVTDLTKQYQLVSQKKSEVIREVVTVEVNSESDRLKIKTLEEQLIRARQETQQYIHQLEDEVAKWKSDYTALNIKKQEIIRETVTIEVSSEADRQRIRKLEDQLQQLQVDYQKLSLQKQEVVREYITVEVNSEADRLKIRTLEDALNNLRIDYQNLSIKKQEVIKETVTVQVPQESDRLRIRQLEDSLSQLRQDYQILNTKKQEVIRETVTVEVSSEQDRLRIRQLEDTLQQLRQDYSLLNIKKQEVIRETVTVEVSSEQDRQKIMYLQDELNRNKQELANFGQRYQQLEFQFSQLQSDYQIVNLKKQEVIRETVTVQVSSEQDKLRIKQLEDSLQQLRQDYQVLSQRKQEVIRETVTVEVSSESDKLRIRQLEELLTQTRSELQTISLRKQEVIKETVTVQVSSEQDKLRIRQLEDSLNQMRIDFEQLRSKKQEVIRETIEVSSERDRQRIIQLEDQLQRIQSEYQVLSMRKQEVIKEFVEVPNEQDKFKIRQLEQQIAQLQIDIKFTIEEKFRLETQYKQLQSEFVIVNQKSQQVITREVSSQQDKILIQNLQTQILELKDQISTLERRKPQVVKETVQVEDTTRIMGLQRQLKQLESEYQLLEQQYQENRKIGDENFEQYQQAQMEINQLKQQNQQLASYQEQIRILTIKLEEKKNYELKLKDLQEQYRLLEAKFEEQRRTSGSILELETQLSQSERLVSQFKNQVNQCQSQLQAQELQFRKELEILQSQYSKNMEQEILTATKQFEIAKSREIDLLKRNFEQYQDENERLRRDIRSLEEQTRKTDEIDSLKKKYEVQLDSLRNELDSQKLQIKQLTNNREQIRVELVSANQMVQARQHEFEELRRKCSQFELQNRSLLRELEDSKNQNQEEFLSLKRELKNRIDMQYQLEQQISQIESQLSKKMHSQHEQRIQELTLIITQKDAKIRDLTYRIEELKEITQQKKQQQVIVRETQNNTKISELQHQLDSLSLELTRQRNQKDELIIKHELLIQRATEYESEINILKSELNKRSVPKIQNGSSQFLEYKSVTTNGVKDYDMDSYTKVTSQQIKSQLNSGYKVENPLRTDVYAYLQQIVRSQINDVRVKYQ